MGCLKKILIKIIVLVLIVGFFALGGWRATKDKIKMYKNPPRDEFIRTEISYADFSDVSVDYQLSRCFNFFGYKKVSAKYIPTEQKITIFDLKKEEKIKEQDFKDKTIDKKISIILDKLKDSYITFDNFEIISRGNFKAKNATLPYIVFQAHVRNIPFKEVKGIIAMHSSKLFFTMVDKKAHNPKIMSDFIGSLRF